MLGSITPLGERGRGSRWWLTSASYVGASTFGGLLVGTIAGFVGAALRLVGLRLTRRRPCWSSRPPPFSGWWPTPGSWASSCRPCAARSTSGGSAGTGGWVVGAGFGLQLGLGVATIVPASAASLSVAGGALVGLEFGAVRAAPLLAAARTPEALRRLHLRLAGLSRPADRTIRSVQAGLAASALVLALTAVG